MKIAFLLTRHPPDRPSPIFPEVVRLLRARGATVDVVYPDEQLTELRELRVEHDLYVLKCGSETAMSLAGALHSLGAAILNPYPAASICRDKIVASRVLDEAGIPAPASYACSRPAQLIPLLGDGPLIVKPYRGSQGRGVRIVRRAGELLDGGFDGEPLFVQRYLPPEGCDRKLYRIGDDVFGVERVWPARTYEEKVGRPFVVSSELREIALACGEALGLSLFGFDVVVSGGKPFVVDISSFPGFKGVPEAAVRLADYIERSGGRSVARPRLVAAPDHVSA